MKPATPEWQSDEAREGGESAEARRAGADFEADAPPASAGQFHIADLQHWVDLSA